jgi:diguanylate cyclase (GGDEF)-like protein
VSLAHGAPVRWAGLLDGLIDAVCLVEPRAHEIVAANAACATLFGLPPAGLLGRRFTEFATTPMDLALWDDVREASQDWPAGESREHDTMLIDRDGRPRPVALRLTRLPPGAGDGLWLAALRDREDEVSLRRALDARVAELQATMESTADGLLVTDLAGRLLNFNRRFAALWHLPADLLEQRDDAAIDAWMQRSVSDRNAWSTLNRRWGDSALLETRDLVQLHAGTLLEVVSRPLLSRGAPIGRVTAFRDLTEHQRSRDEIHRLSHTDALTGLANRRHFAERMQRRLAPRDDGPGTAALLLVNLDRFRTVNDSLGPAAADMALAEAARRLLQATDEGDVMARLAGDEFAIGLRDADARRAEAIARRLLAALAPSFELEGTAFSLTCSIGIALAPTDGNDLESLLRHADAAVRRAKEAGRATYRFYQPRRNVDLHDRLELDHAMRKGLAAGHFRIDVQPQFDLADGSLAGVEALARWRDPALGEVGPGRFIPVAEDSGFIVELGQWVLEQAVREAARWWRHGARFPVSVNVSALQFRHPEFVDRVAATLAAAGLPAAGLELELTESILVGDACEALARLKELDALGVRLALDDFGTGYSSLAVLKRFPISRLKIDRSFVASLPAGDSDAAIVSAIVAMAQALHMNVVAEGVETEPQRAFLQHIGCHVMQGFLKSRPLALGDFERRWSAGEWSTAPQAPAHRAPRTPGNLTVPGRLPERHERPAGATVLPLRPRRPASRPRVRT